MAGPPDRTPDIVVIVLTVLCGVAGLVVLLAGQTISGVAIVVTSVTALIAEALATWALPRMRGTKP